MTKTLSVVLLTAGQTHARFKKELEKGEIFPVLERAKIFSICRFRENR